MDFSSSKPQDLFCPAAALRFCSSYFLPQKFPPHTTYSKTHQNLNTTSTHPVKMNLGHGEHNQNRQFSGGEKITFSAFYKSKLLEHYWETTWEKMGTLEVVDLERS